MSKSTPHRSVLLSYEVHSRDDWELSEEQVPESKPHDRRTELIFELLDHWIHRTGADAEVARNLAVRWDREHPRVGIDPDVCLIAPRPPEGAEIESLLLWLPGHHPLRIAFEIVSSRPDKDYVRAPEKYAVNGTFELVVFDPVLRGASLSGGPYRIQVWRRGEGGSFARVAAGEGPFHLQALDAWVFAVDEGRQLRFADDREGTQWWRTSEEASREDAARAREEAAGARARIAELEAKLRGD
ncbi:MAG: Uma2 family endonuclease [Polyangiales bacterium]